MATQLYLKRVKTSCGFSYALVDQDGDMLPEQVKTSLVSETGALPLLIVEFRVGTKRGVQVIDDGADDAHAS